MKKDKTHIKGFGLATIVQTALIILKLTNSIDWSWKSVLMPLWIGLVVFFISFVVLFIASRLVFRNRK